MTSYSHQKYSAKNISKASRYVHGLLILIWQLFFTGISIYLSISDHVLVWLIGQILLGINFLQWFFLLHELGHGVFIPDKILSVIFGHIAAVFSLIPYYPWKFVHHAHHKWTGWREKDPTVPEIPYEELPKGQKKLLDFCWKYWIPIIAFSYVLSTFYHIKRLKNHFPDPKLQVKNYFSIILNIIVYTILIFALGPLFFKIWGIAFLIYLSISDPYLLSQHVHLDYKDIEKELLKPVKFEEQDMFSRTIRFPKLLEKYIFYSSNYHGLHHQYPWLTLYELDKFKKPNHNEIYWMKWLRRAKSLPGSILIFKSFKHTGVKL